MKLFTTWVKIKIKQLRCDHSWRAHGFSWIGCALCEKIKYDPTRSARLTREYISDMVDAGLWDIDEVNRGLLSRGLDVIVKS